MKKKVKFEEEFHAGYKCYDADVGNWWYEKSIDVSHRNAYKNIVKFIISFYKDLGTRPGFIIDYACGPGRITALLAAQYPEAIIVGLDGSEKMLHHASRFLKSKRIGYCFSNSKEALKKNGCPVRLVKTTLPNFSLPKGKADLVVLALPNIVPVVEEQPYYDKHGYQNKKDAKVGRLLSVFTEKKPEDNSIEDPDEIFDQLMTQKVISRNIAKLLKKKGHVIRADYSEADKNGITKGARLRLDFEQGALTKKVKDAGAEQIFKIKDYTYKKSKVIVDVYQQNNDYENSEGGYLITGLQKICKKYEKA